MSFLYKKITGGLNMKQVCNGVCRYVEYKDTQACIGCGRTYDDLDRWAYLTDKQKREIIKIARVTLKTLKNWQKFE
jgi:predicted Fe-S protein YdhL (DUF1289 family)